jgi:two-component system, sensor histidine kinase
MGESIRTVLAAIVVGTAFGALAHASIALTRDGGPIGAVWLPNALALAGLLRLVAAREPLLLGAMWLGNAFAAYVAGDSALTAATLASCNLLEIAIALILIRRLCGPRAQVERIDHLARMLACAGLAAPAVSATLATLVLGLEGELSPALWGGWFIAHALGMVVLTPVALILLDAMASPRRPNPRELAEWAALTLAGAATTAAVFLQGDYPLLFLIAPVVLLHAFRLGSLGTAVSVIVVAVVATLCTWHGSGPINLIEGPLGVRLIVLQAMLAAAFAMALPVAAVLAGQRRLVARLEGQGASLRLLTDNVSDAVLRFDVNGICSYASPSVGAVLGLPPATLLGRAISERAHPTLAEIVGGLHERERVTYRRSNDSDAGEPEFVEVDTVATRDPDTDVVDGIVVRARSATDRVRLERELASTRQVVAEADDARATFVAGMNGAIRARLEHLQVAALQLAHTELPPQQQEQADTIAAAGARLLRLLGAADELATIEAGRRRVRNVPVGLRQLLETCVSAHRPQARRQGVGLTLACGPDIPATLVTDGAHVRQILLAVIGNAVRHTRGGVITVRARAERSEIAIAVEDSGPGIGSDRREAVFAPFVDLGNVPQGGTGLSLAIARKLAGMLAGTLVAEGGAEGGARFVLRLPRQLPGSLLERRAEPSDERAAAA